MLAFYKLENNAVGFLADKVADLPLPQFRVGEIVTIDAQWPITAKITGLYVSEDQSSYHLPYSPFKTCYSVFYVVQHNSVLRGIPELELLQYNPRRPSDLFDYLI